MSERELPPEGERIDLREAASILGRSLKATQQIAARGTLKTAREVEPGATRARRIVTTRAWIEEYLEGQKEPSTPPTSRREREPDFLFAEPALASAGRGGAARYWQEIAERQAVEILRLHARIAELEAAPGLPATSS